MGRPAPLRAGLRGICGRPGRAAGCGERLASATNEIFLHLLRAKHEVPQQRSQQILALQGDACKLCGAPIALGTCGFDQVVPVSTAFRGRSRSSRRSATSASGSRPAWRIRTRPVKPHVVRDLRELAKAVAAGLRTGEVERGLGLLGHAGARTWCAATKTGWPARASLCLCSARWIWCKKGRRDAWLT